jgi:hypothetical protein
MLDTWRSSFGTHGLDGGLESPWSGDDNAFGVPQCGQQNKIKETTMTAEETPHDWLPINTGMLTAAGVVALVGALFLGIAALIGSKALMEAAREWTNQQEVPPAESAKALIRLLHNAALAGTTAGAEAWKSELSTSSTD